MASHDPDRSTLPSDGIRAPSPAARHPALSFVLLAFAWSWTFWTVPTVLSEEPSPIWHHVGGFGPMVAALVLLRTRGIAPLRWLAWAIGRPVGLRYWLFALLWPIGLALAATSILAALGYPLSNAPLSESLLAYLPSLLFLAVVGGGNEEPGWRGFLLPTLQARRSPLAATLVLGTIWAVWHVPLVWSGTNHLSALDAGVLARAIGLTFASILLHAFWYTWLWNRTGSILACIALHASYNAANTHFLLIEPVSLAGAGYLVALLTMTGLVAASAIALLFATGGRLGYDDCAVRNAVSGEAST